MESVKSEGLIKLFLKKFEGFDYYVGLFLKNFGEGNGLTIQTIPITDYIVDVINSGDVRKIKEFFGFVEYLLSHGDKDVQVAIKTDYKHFNPTKDRKFYEFKQPIPIRVLLGLFFLSIFPILGFVKI